MNSYIFLTCSAAPPGATAATEECSTVAPARPTHVARGKRTGATACKLGLKATTAGLAAARATQINAALIILGAIMRAVCKQAIVLDSRCSRCRQRCRSFFDGKKFSEMVW